MTERLGGYFRPKMTEEVGAPFLETILADIDSLPSRSLTRLMIEGQHKKR